MTTSKSIAIDPARANPLQASFSRRLAWAKGRAASAAPWELVALLAVMSGGVFIHACNAFNYPRYQGDEGVYMSAAWAVAHGQIYPYTYNYGHPPLAWTLIAAWCQLTGGFFTFGTAINTGRVFMLVIYACSALLVYLIARRLAGNLWVAFLATTIFSFSPLSVNYQRQVLIDNVATIWILLAFYLQVISDHRLRYLVGSALAYGIGVLSKETMIILLPAFLYGTWLQTTKFQRRYALIVFAYLAIAMVSAFVLLATLKNELFPSGTLLGGKNPHVSLIATFLQQAARGTSQGSFLGQWIAWQKTDGFIMVTGMASVFGNLLLGWRKPMVRVLALLALIYFIFLARGGVTLAYYLIPLLPLSALNIALIADGVTSFVLSRAMRVIGIGHGTLNPARWIVPLIVLASIALLLPYDLHMNRTNLTANETGPQVAAIQWVGEQLPHSAEIIANHYVWLDLRSGGGLGSTQGAPFNHIEMYWIVATDPAIHTGVLHDDWNNIDYIIVDSDVTVDVAAFHMTLLQAAMKHAIPIKTFRNRLYWVTIYEVQHVGSTDPTAPTLIQSPTPPKGLPGSAPTTAASGG